MQRPTRLVNGTSGKITTGEVKETVTIWARSVILVNRYYSAHIKRQFIVTAQTQKQSTAAQGMQRDQPSYSKELAEDIVTTIRHNKQRYSLSPVHFNEIFGGIRPPQVHTIHAKSGGWT